ncbi:PepSY-associated TM helix domain-containing protein [Thermosynechococcaceae cyanobacterium BACA0444]|uniref:PepSY-associated TM helix domain-containing protein n=1 Tax=Pseudocalidococcus azoricus BACA0444 TaxID=2918990 RepID=A0AAE4FWJ1_9CYAN|nr:PepSY-associated TM helix domain-containing protein [Pseudocalidococcus azoricus]MDS3862281.1 PepSY-associated TM helix domain-containing protein [Pseudocalidococcus azoricus BACA0444]
MNRKTIRHFFFYIHSTLGLVVGILLCIAGVTGSILVFWHEIDVAILTQHFGSLIPTNTPISLTKIQQNLEALATSKNFHLDGIAPSSSLTQFYQAWLEDDMDHHWQAWINQYTGEILGIREWETSWVGRIYDLHYKLSAGDTGTIIMGIVALLTVFIAITGIVLWPGWRKLIAGFRIKWQSHIRRRNFDVHKVAGIVAAVFLIMIGFTGFAWNIPQAKVNDAIHAITFSPKSEPPVISPVANQQPLSFGVLAQQAQSQFPEARITFLHSPHTETEPASIYFKQTGENSHFGNSSVDLNPYTGEILNIKDGLNPSTAEAIINQFGPVHYGTFGGMTTRIFYVLIGLLPVILLLTGFIMFWHRRKVKVHQPLST